MRAVITGKRDRNGTKKLKSQPMAPELTLKSNKIHFKLAQNAKNHWVMWPILRVQANFIEKSSRRLK
jgi:hypothetical protein